MKKIIIVIILLMVSMPSLAAAQTDTPSSQYNLLEGRLDPWTKDDTYRQLGVTIITLFDLKQTDIGLKNGAYEHSPFIVCFTGDNPDIKQIRNLTCAWLIINPVIAFILPKNIRRIFQDGTMIITFFEVKDSVGTKIWLKY